MMVVPRVLALLFVAVWCSAGESPGTRAPWTRIVTPGFELLTTGGEDAGQSLLIRLERLKSVLRPIFGERSEKAVCIIEFGTRDEFQPYAPMSRSIGYFLPGARRDFVVLDGTHAEGRSAGHEYVHFAISQSGLRLPAWLNEGLAELYSNVDESRTVGRFIAGRVFALRRGDWISLDDLSTAGADSEAFTSAGSVDAAYSESWLLAHMLALDPRYQDRFADLLAALQAFPAAEAFEKVYGMSLSEVEQDLRGYLEAGEKNARVLGETERPAGPPVMVEPQADFEGLSALAEMLGNYQGRTGQSRELYREIARDYPRRLAEAAARSAIPSTVATWMDFARPSFFSNLICSQEGSNSYQARPWRAEVGCAW